MLYDGLEGQRGQGQPEMFITSSYMALMTQISVTMNDAGCTAIRLYDALIQSFICNTLHTTGQAN